MKAAFRIPANLSIVHILAVLVALIVADGIVTASIVEQQLGYEANPFLHGFSGPNAILVKVAGALLAALVLWDIQKTRPRVALSTAICSVVLYTVVIFWNVSIFALA